MSTSKPSNNPRLNSQEQSFIRSFLMKRFMEGAPQSVIDEVKHQHGKIQEAKYILENVKRDSERAINNVLDNS